MDHRLESLVRIPPRLLFPMVFTFCQASLRVKLNTVVIRETRGVFVRRHPAPPLSGCRF